MALQRPPGFVNPPPPSHQVRLHKKRPRSPENINDSATTTSANNANTQQKQTKKIRLFSLSSTTKANAAIVTPLTRVQRKSLVWLEYVLQKHNGASISHAMGNGKTLLAIAACLRAYHQTCHRCDYMDKRRSKGEGGGGGGGGSPIQARNLVSERKRERECLCGRGRERVSLVVAQKSVLTVWRSEANKHLSAEWARRVLIIHASLPTPSSEQLASAFLLVTTYETLSTVVPRIRRTLNLHQPYALFILDEGHLIRNADTLRRSVCSAVHTRRRILLSGTPFQNNVADLISEIGFLGVAPFHTLASRRDVYMTAALQHKDAFFRALRCNFLRDTINEQMVSSIQKRVFIVARAFAKRERLRFDDMVLEEECDDAHAFRRRNLILEFCGTSPSKVESLRAYVRTKWHAGTRFVVFANYRAQQRNALEALLRWKVRAKLISGDLSIVERAHIIDQFHAQETNDEHVERIDALVLSFRACNTGLNLPQAQDVIFMDMSDANPFNYLQAQARVFRPGQHAKEVRVFFFVVSRTLEAHVPYLHSAKCEVAQCIMAAIPSTVHENNLSDKEARVQFDRALSLTRGRARGGGGNAYKFSLSSSVDIHNLIEGIRTQNVYLRTLVASYHLDGAENATHLCSDFNAEYMSLLAPPSSSSSSSTSPPPCSPQRDEKRTGIIRLLEAIQFKGDNRTRYYAGAGAGGNNSGEESEGEGRMLACALRGGERLVAFDFDSVVTDFFYLDTSDSDKDESGSENESENESGNESRVNAATNTSGAGTRNTSLRVVQVCIRDKVPGLLYIDIGVLEERIQPRSFKGVSFAQLYAQVRRVWGLLSSTPSASLRVELQQCAQSHARFGCLQQCIVAGEIEGLFVQRSTRYDFYDANYPRLCGHDMCFFIPRFVVATTSCIGL